MSLTLTYLDDTGPHSLIVPDVLRMIRNIQNSKNV